MKLIDIVYRVLREVDDIRYRVAGFKHGDKKVNINVGYHVTKSSDASIFVLPDYSRINQHRMSHLAFI